MDIRTLLFADLVVQICCATALLLMSRAVVGLGGLRWFGWSYASIALGIALSMAGEAMGSTPGLFVGRCAVLLGAILLTEGIADFSVPGASVLAWGGFLLAFFAATEIYCLRHAGGEMAAVVVFAVTVVAQFLIGVLLLFTHEPASERDASRATGAMLSAVAVLFLARAILAPLRVDPVHLLSNDPVRFGGVVIYMVLSAGMAFGFVWMMTARLREQLEVQASTDALTGVLNRRALELLIDREIVACRRRAAPMAVLALDLDRFKDLNDAHGHAAGDAMLAATARLLAQSVRATDLVARYGGEEFIVALPGRDATRGFEIAERLRDRLAGLQVDYAGLALSVTVSIGVAALGDATDHWRALLARADRGLYAAKQDGRNRTRLVADPPLGAVGAIVGA